MTVSPLYLIAEQPFQAAREWPRGRLHGHGFRCQVAVAEADCPGDFPGDAPDALGRSLTRAVEPLDYALVNDHIEHTDDASIAAWLLGRSGLAGQAAAWLASDPDCGAVVGAGGDSHLWARFRFEAAHRLPNVPDGHKCGRMHGHGFEVTLQARLCANQPALERQRELRLSADRLREELDYSCLNEIPGLDNPTSEMIASWIWARLHPSLKGLSGVTVKETASAGCHYDGQGWRIWITRSFDSAVMLDRAPAGDGRGGLHGHTFQSRLHLQGALDEVLGWVEDYGDVKRKFEPVERALDHRPLHEDAALGGSDAASIARHVESEMTGAGLALDRVDVLHRPGRGAILSPGGPVELERLWP